MSDEQSEQRVLNRREAYFLAALQDDTLGQIDFQIARAEDCISPLWLNVAQRSAETREQFGAIERFGHVIVRAGVEGCDFVIFAVTHAQDDNWHTAPLAQTLEHFH